MNNEVNNAISEDSQTFYPKKPRNHFAKIYHTLVKVSVSRLVSAKDGSDEAQLRELMHGS